MRPVHLLGLVLGVMRKRTLWYLMLAMLCCALVLGATQVKKVARWKKHAPTTLATAPLDTKMQEPGQTTVKGGASVEKLKAAEKKIGYAGSISTARQDPAMRQLLQDKAVYERWLRTGTATPQEKTMIRERFLPTPVQQQYAVDNIGGPDGSQYYFTDNVSPDTATYDWIELCGDNNATDGPMGDDITMTVYPGFSFPFYGTGYTSCHVSTNGSISFGGAIAWHSASDPASTVATYPFIAPLWTDLFAFSGFAGSGCNHDGNYPMIRYRSFGTYLVVEWADVPQFMYYANHYRFEAILYSNGMVKVQFHTSFNMTQYTADGNTCIGVDGTGAGDGVRYFYAPMGGTPVGIPPAGGRAIWFYQRQITGVDLRVSNLLRR